VSVCSFSSSFGAALRFLSGVAVDGAVEVCVCSYGSGTAYLSFDLPPAVAAVWPAVRSLAFEDRPYEDSVFVAEFDFGPEGARRNAIEALLETVLAPVVEPVAPTNPGALGAMLRAKLDEVATVKRVRDPEARIVGVYHDGEKYCLLGVGVHGEEMWTQAQADSYFA